MTGGGRVGTDEPKSRHESEVPTEDGEEGEAMDDTNQDDEAMMAMMGLSGFGTTKVRFDALDVSRMYCLSRPRHDLLQGKHVEGNQEGGANIKKIRTWRQYMNRRGGFNRSVL